VAVVSSGGHMGQLVEGEAQQRGDLGLVEKLQAVDEEVAAADNQDAAPPHGGKREREGKRHQKQD